MKIARALKEKNRLAGEVSALFAILLRENSRDITKTSVVDCEKVYKEWVDKKMSLANVKARIAIANKDITEKIFQMEELKSQMTSLDSLCTKVGKHKEMIGPAYGNQQQVENVYEAYITDDIRDKFKKELQSRINTLQDEIDDFNSSKEI